MKKITFLVTSLAASATFSFAQSAIVGWDFSQYGVDGFSTTDGSTITKSLTANYANGTADFTGASSLGTLFYNGSNGSTNFEADGSNPEEVSPLQFGNTSIGSQGYLGLTGSLNILDSQGQGFENNRAFGLTTNGSFSFLVTPGGATNFTTLEYASFNSDDTSSSLFWEYSTNGGATFVGLETDAITDNASAFSVDLSSVTGQSSAIFRGTLSGLDSNAFFLDNVEISGTVIPEPSTYAVLLGALSLAFVAYRRRAIK